MQAYAEGFDILKNATSENYPPELRYDLNVADIAEVWRRGSVITFVAARSHFARDGERSQAREVQRVRWKIPAKAVGRSTPRSPKAFRRRSGSLPRLSARFRSRVQHTFAEKVLSAMRFGFGGHVEKK